jgi:gas vesicle protein
MSHHRGEDTALVAVISFLLGGMLGAGIALLVAPQAGKKTRQMITDFAEDVRDQATDYADKVKRKLS